MPVSSPLQWLRFGSINGPLSEEIFHHLHSKLGLNFDEEYDENQFLVGWKAPSPDDKGISTQAVRHFDTSPGLVIQIAWREERPSNEVLHSVASDIRAALETLPE